MALNLDPHVNTTEVLSLPALSLLASRRTIPERKHCALECACFAPAQTNQTAHVEGFPVPSRIRRTTSFVPYFRLIQKMLLKYYISIYLTIILRARVGYLQVNALGE